MELISRRTIVELEGEEGVNQVDEYADSSSERGKAMRKAIAEKFHFSSLDFQTLEGVIEAIEHENGRILCFQFHPEYMGWPEPFVWLTELAKARKA